MSKLPKVIFAAIFVLLAFYLSLPTPKFPFPPLDSVQSMEEADTETPIKRAYFTDYTRAEVLEHYRKQLANSQVLNLPLPTYRLNYPPEDAFSLIRDQTRSTFLEEIVHPLRESFFVNGFEPKLAKDEIWYKGRHFRQKITVKYVPSSLFVRLGIAFLTLIAVWILAKEVSHAVKKFKT